MPFRPIAGSVLAGLACAALAACTHDPNEPLEGLEPVVDVSPAEAHEGRAVVMRTPAAQLAARGFAAAQPWEAEPRVVPADVDDELRPEEVGPSRARAR